MSDCQHGKCQDKCQHGGWDCLEKSYTRTKTGISGGRAKCWIDKRIPKGKAWGQMNWTGHFYNQGKPVRIAHGKQCEDYPKCGECS